MDIGQGRKFVNPKLKRLEKLVDGWIAATSEYCRRIEDAGYSYNERVNVSLLCAGAWLEGLVAIEEYVCRKNHKNRGEFGGRADLFVVIGNNNASIEAKQSWVNASKTREKIRDVVNKKLEEAVDDVRCVDEYADKFGACFFIPNFSDARFPEYKENNEKIITELIGKFINGSAADLWAWCFPIETRFERTGNKYYPGVIVAFRADKLL